MSECVFVSSVRVARARYLRHSGCRWIAKGDTHYAHMATLEHFPVNIFRNFFKTWIFLTNKVQLELRLTVSEKL